MVTQPILTGIVAGAIAMGILIWNLVWLVRLDRRFKKIFRNEHINGLEEVLQSLGGEMENFKSSLTTIETHVESLESRAESSIKHVGVVRFNPFKDAGSDQSFVVALLDELRSGVVISSLYSRDGVRVYAKPIAKGTSSYQLSEEEQEALRKALA